MSLIHQAQSKLSLLKLDQLELAKISHIQWDLLDLKLLDIYLQISSSWNSERQKEFLAGRYLAHSSLKQWGIDSWSNPILIGDHRQPLFDSIISASITHNKHVVIFGMAKGQCLVGIDVEARNRITRALARQILTKEDEAFMESLAVDSDFGFLDLLTLIFSAKEACYKALFPYVGEYFGMLDAYIEKMDLGDQSFELVITKKFAALRPKDRLLLKGYYNYDESNIFTYLVPVSWASIGE